MSLAARTQFFRRVVLTASFPASQGFRSIRTTAAVLATFRKPLRRTASRPAPATNDNALAPAPPPPPPSAPALPDGWFEARTPEGKPYYYTADGRTQWESPVVQQQQPQAMTMPGLAAPPAGGGGLFQVVKEGLAFGVGNAVAHHAVSSIFNSFGGGGSSSSDAASPAAPTPSAPVDTPSSMSSDDDDDMGGFFDDD